MIATTQSHQTHSVNPSQPTIKRVRVRNTEPVNTAIRIVNSLSGWYRRMMLRYGIKHSSVCDLVFIVTYYNETGRSVSTSRVLKEFQPNQEGSRIILSRLHGMEKKGLLESRFVRGGYRWLPTPLAMQEIVAFGSKGV